MTKDVLKSFDWRYATKVYDSSKKVEADKLDVILESIRLAPTSFGLQAFKCFRVQDKEMLKSLRKVSWDQPIIEDCSELLVFAVPLELTEADIDKYIQLIADTRGTTTEAYETYKQFMLGYINPKTDIERTEWLKKQTYIALGFALETAGLEKIDSTPVEGFDRELFDKTLGLDKAGYTVSVVMPIGYRLAQEDKYSSLPKVRKPAEEIFTIV